MKRVNSYEQILKEWESFLNLIMEKAVWENHNYSARNYQKLALWEQLQTE